MVLRSNITIDGTGFTLNGTEAALLYGLKVEGYQNVNVTIQNMTIIGYLNGISLVSTNYNKILECNITGCINGIWGTEIMNTTFSENII